MFRRSRRRTPATPVTDVPVRWRPTLEEVVRLADELQRLVTVAADGPVRQRLGEFEQALQQHVGDIAAIATRGAALIRLTDTVDVDTITAAYKKAKREGSPDAEALERQHASAQRLLNALDDVDAHVAGAARRVRELLLAAGELSLTGSETALAHAQDSIARLADEATALRDAMRTLS